MTNRGDSMDPSHMDIIGSIRTNAVMKKVWKMSNIKRHIENPGNHHGIIGASTKPG